MAERCTELTEKQVASPEAKGFSLILKGNDTRATEFFFLFWWPTDKRSCRSFSIWLYSPFTASLALDQKGQPLMWEGHYA